MIREPNIIEHLPLFIQEYQEIEQIMNAENPEFKLVIDESEVVKNNQFIVSCDLKGIKRFEKILNIPVDEGSSLNSRIARVLMRWNDNVPYTISALKSKLNDVLGQHGYELNIAEYILQLDMLEAKYESIKIVVELLRYMCPMNLVVILCNIYKHKIPNPNTVHLSSLAIQLYNQYYAADIQLDGKRYLDGSWQLNGDTPHKADLESLEIQASLPNKYGTVQSLSIAVIGAPPPYKQNVSINVGAGVKNTNKVNYQATSIYGSIANTSKLIGTVTTDTMWYLDDSFMLDDSRILNADIIIEQI